MTTVLVSIVKEAEVEVPVDEAGTYLFKNGHVTADELTSMSKLDIATAYVMRAEGQEVKPNYSKHTLALQVIE